MVSIMFQKGRNNTVLGPVFDQMKKAGTKSNEGLGPLDLLDVIPARSPGAFQELDSHGRCAKA